MTRMMKFRLPILATRRSLRVYVFVVVFTSTLVLFTMTPASQSIPTPLQLSKHHRLQLLYHPQTYWTRLAVEPHLEYDLHSEPTPPTPQQPLPTHTFRPDGLLQVNPDAPHPIFDLIARAEHEWNTKLVRASRTLPDAVREYHRRYARAPPPGFDRWWAYVVKHNVQLPDEYDQIHHDLAPFWAIKPTRLQAIQYEWESHASSYTLAKSDLSGALHIANDTLPSDEHARRRLLEGAHRLLALMADVEGDLPLFRAVFSPDDNPGIFLTEEMRSRAVAAGESGDYIDIDNEPTSFTVGWLHACPINSPARQAPLDTETEYETPKNKTFIYDHLLAMDPCNHPSHLSLHGQFLSYGAGPSAKPYPIPLFSYCSTSLHADIRIPHVSSWMADVEGESGELGAWELKEDERLLWRGMNTGIYHSGNKPWEAAQRSRLVDMAQRGVGNVEVLVGNSEGEGMRVEEVKKMRLNHAMLDIAFAGSPHQCETETCRELENVFEWRRRMSVKDAGKYKYVLDVDGNGWSSRFKRLMTTNSLIFKSTVYPEWFTDRLAPWVHYIPIQVDYSDLYDALVFFRGDLAGQGAHEELAAKIARAGREWSLTFWREEDIVAYVFRLFLEYGRVMSEDRDKLSFELTDD